MRRRSRESASVSLATQQNCQGASSTYVSTGPYAVLYGLLCSEDSAILLGSALLLAVLTAVMVLTRRLDWYDVGKLQVDGV